MQTIEIDDETYASLDALAKEEHSTISSVLKRVASRIPGRLHPAPPAKQTAHGYKWPVSKGSRPFGLEDVQALEDDNDMRGLS